MEKIGSFTPANLLTDEGDPISRITPPEQEVLRCSGCTCVEPCRIAQIASTLLHAEAVAYYRLGDILDFSVSPNAIKGLKNYIALALKDLSMQGADKVLSKLAILPTPSSYTLATTGDNYAVIFVTGQNYTTHVVEVP